MFNFAILDLVIGLIFVFFLVSLTCSVVRELISGVLDLRAKNLNRWIVDTFEKGGLGKAILAHDLVSGLTRQGKLASYIPSDVFVNTLLDIISRDNPEPITIDSLRHSVQTSPYLTDGLRRKILQNISEAQGDLNNVRKNLQTWFDQSMQRISGTYKKNSQVFILITALLVAGTLNVDTIAITDYLYSHPSQTAELADRISEQIKNHQQYVKAPNDTTSAKINDQITDLKALNAQLQNTKLPIGWESVGNVNPLAKTLGLIITALATLAGAPFWFELLNKLVNLRGAGNKPATASDGKSKKKDNG